MVEMEGDTNHVLSTNEIKIINGPIGQDDAYDIIKNSDEPIIFKSMIEHWKARQWTIECFCERFFNLPTTFKVCPRLENDENDKPIMETDCLYVDGKIGHFMKWLKGRNEKDTPLNQFPRDHFSLYIDYKHMRELFTDNENDVLKEIDWEIFGYHGKNGEDSTLWIGSDDAFTPLHKDTYGCNLVAQLFGKKKWKMFHPKDTEKLYPVRIPYEESSVFSAINIDNPDHHKYPRFLEATTYEAILKAGDVLYVPKHWWHFVQNIDPSISVNIWLPEKDDDFDRLKEAIVRLLVCSLKRSENEEDKYWLNPKEEELPTAANLNYIKMALEQLSLKSHNLDNEKKEKLNKSFENSDLLVNCFTSDKLIDLIAQEVISKI